MKKKSSIEITSKIHFDKCILITKNKEVDGFALQKNVMSAIKNFKVINSRLVVLIIEIKWFNIASFNVHII